MKVSVIVPVYNVEKYLKKCLDSLVNQTLEDIEILIVNDGSPDDSQSIIDEYKKKYPMKIKSFRKENGGLASARNYALDYVQGEYVGFVDSDDWVDLQMFEMMYNNAHDTDADIVLCNTVDHYNNYDVYHKQTEVGKFRKCGSACNKIYRTSFVGKERFPDGLWFEDLAFTIKLLMQTEKIGHCEGHYYHAFNREGSILHNNNSEKNLDIITVIEGIIDFAMEKDLYEKYSYDIEYMILEHILITSINRVAAQRNNKKKETIMKLRQYVLDRYPEFYRDSVFHEFTKNQRIVARLNAKGLEKVSQQLFKLKSLITRN